MSEPHSYYNEHDKYAAAWLRNLIAAGHIAPGDVDERDTRDVKPSDLRGYVQCHFFAGIGVWSHSLRRAGWPDRRPVWTASCPCQPFSAAGKGGGLDDERHLWPAFFHLVGECGPTELFGEQVASKDGLAWLDLVQSDMEGAGYAFGALDLCAAGFGAPHIRQRMYWMAHDTQGGRRKERADTGGLAFRDRAQRDAAGLMHGCSASQLEHSVGAGSQGLAGHGDHRDQSGRLDAGACRHAPASGAALDQLADANGGDQSHRDLQRSGIDGLKPCDDLSLREGHPGVGHNSLAALAPCGTGPTNGFWRDTDWIFCRDGKWRPVEPGTFPLAHGMPRSMGTCGAELRRLAGLAGLDAKSLARAKKYRVGSLSAYGNAIVAPQAEEFIGAYLDVEHFRLSLESGIFA